MLILLTGDKMAFAISEDSCDRYGIGSTPRARNTGVIVRAVSEKLRRLGQPLWDNLCWNMESQMARAIVMRAPGGPEVLNVENVDVGNPGLGQARLRQTAVGVNFHDIYVRSGLYKTLPLPGIPGLEAVGVVEAIGPGVTQVRVGDRVGCLTANYGSYAEARLVDADSLIQLPDSLDDRSAAATLLRGLTAQMLVHHVHKIGPGQVVLVHAASGGVGRLVCRWAHHLGATVIGTLGSEEKARSARENGCDHVILYRTENFVERVQAVMRRDAAVRFRPREALLDQRLTKPS